MFSTRDQWINNFYNIKSINKKEFEKGINWLYTDLLKKKKPKIIYVDDWVSCVLSIHILKNLNNNTIENTIWSTVENTIRNTIGITVNNTVSSTVENTVNNTVENTINNTVWNTFLEYSNYTNSYSNFGWVSFYDYFEKIGVLKNKNFQKYKKLIQSGAFQVYEYENIVFAVEPPKHIKRNERGQVHNIEEAAIEFKNGYKQYYINNLNIPENIFIKLKNEEYTIENFALEKK